MSSASRSLPVIGKLESPLTTYYLILGATSTLVVFGLIMVFAASSVEAILADEASYAVFVRQLLFAVVALTRALRAPPGAAGPPPRRRRREPRSW